MKEACHPEERHRACPEECSDEGRTFCEVLVAGLATMTFTEDPSLRSG